MVDCVHITNPLNCDSEGDVQNFTFNVCSLFWNATFGMLTELGI